MNLLQRARIHLQQARQEATHGVTANNAFIDQMVDEALDLLSTHLDEPARLLSDDHLVDDTDYNREALVEIEKLLRPENYDGSDEQVAKAWELANYRLAVEMRE